MIFEDREQAIRTITSQLITTLGAGNLEAQVDFVINKEPLVKAIFDMGYAVGEIIQLVKDRFPNDEVTFTGEKVYVSNAIFPNEGFRVIARREPAEQSHHNHEAA